MRIPIRLILVFLLLSDLSFSSLQAQSLSRAKPNWQNLDLQTDSVFGISTVKAYATLLKGKRSVPVIVAVIDDGVDIDHPELRSLIWTNPKEKAGNKIDDDHNGYVDDLHGWNFLGSAHGDIHYDNTELTRLVRMYRAEFKMADTTHFNTVKLTRYHAYRQMERELAGSLIKHRRGLENLSGFKASLDTLLRVMKNSDPTMQDIKSFLPNNEAELRIKSNALFLYPIYQRSYVIVNYNDNPAYDPRAGKNMDGNANVAGADPTHGTHVAGIIAKVDPNIKLMVIRAVPYGDERDEDVAKAIRYAAANGAKVINMSFAKRYSSNKKEVDDAVKFAVSKDVLLVHAAGNDNLDLEQNDSYPNPVYEGNNGSAASWIEVGASGSRDDQNLKAGLSNYGKNRVDVFAPGINIYSTLPGNEHGLMSGTSMAAPMVAGLAVLIRSYYPSLTAIQVKDIILRSVVKVNHTVTVKNRNTVKQVSFAELCRSAGIVNALNALALAAQIENN